MKTYTNFLSLCAISDWNKLPEAILIAVSPDLESFYSGISTLGLTFVGFTLFALACTCLKYVFYFLFLLLFNNVPDHVHAH